ncbi:MAG: lytic transglycosylase domain-containing protein [Pseudomonadota bacterium]
MPVNSAGAGPRQCRQVVFAFLALVVAALSASVSDASGRAARLCDLAAAKAATTLNVPIEVLLSITRVETGRQIGASVQPWPWTVNMQGKGHWFETEDQARAFVFARFKAGARSFDIGCFQINYRWHGSGFRTIDEMFDPDLNAAYAAEFLKELHSEFGDWPKAVGAYHSRTQRHARKYLSRYDEIRQAVAQQPKPAHNGTPLSPDTSVRELRMRPTGFALIPNGQTRLGSLVPTTPTNPIARPFIAN